jgi:RNA polymerase sigma-70 factor (ECF subfamily)
MEQNTFEIEAKRMRPALLRMATRYLESTDEAEDVVQDALLKLWFLRDRLEQYRSVDALAIVITKHLCINRLRGIRVEKVDLEQGVSIGGGENPEMKLVEEENMKEILEVISTLPDLQQAILRMKHIEGFEVEEIARLTGSTPVAVRTNLSRARKKVKEQFMIHNKVWN